ncbi:MAG: hypothetical protein IKG39_13005 [Lachnospiraceae bacterium]|nr:hypothetical protein [Lachnospiraceae bacterium]
MNKYIEKWKEDYEFKTVVSAGGSFLVTSAFALYNGYLGILYSSLWYGTICVYYLLLVILRGSIIIAGRKYSMRKNWDDIRKKVYLAEAIVLLLLNLSLVIPISIMVLQQKPMNLTLIPAITMAAYTTYKIIMASINLKRRNRISDSLIRLLRTINFIDALVSILALQNTLIMVNSKGEVNGMLPLTSITSGAIWLAILIICVSTLVQSIRSIKEKNG